MTCQLPSGLELALEVTWSGVTAGGSQLASHPPPTAQAAHMALRQHLSRLHAPLLSMSSLCQGVTLGSGMLEG